MIRHWLFLLGMIIVLPCWAVPMEITITGGSNSPPSTNYGPTLVEYCPDGVTLIVAGNYSACPGMPAASGPVGPADLYSPIADPTNPALPYDPGVVGDQTIDQASQAGGGTGAVVGADHWGAVTLDFTPVVTAVNWVSASVQNLGTFLGDWFRHLTNVVASGLSAVVNSVRGAAAEITNGIMHAVVVVSNFLGDKVDLLIYEVTRYGDQLTTAIMVLPGQIKSAFDSTIADIQGQMAGIPSTIVTELQLIEQQLAGLANPAGGGGKGGGGGADPSGNALAGDCANGFTCNSVDPVECSVALEQFQRNCQVAGTNALSSLGMSALQNSGSVDDGNPLRNPDTVDVGAVFAPPVLNSGSCPADGMISVFGSQVAVSYSPLCKIGSVGGYFFLLAAVFTALRIIGAA